MYFHPNCQKILCGPFSQRANGGILAISFLLIQMVPYSSGSPCMFVVFVPTLRYTCISLSTDIIFEIVDGYKQFPRFIGCIVANNSCCRS